MANFPVFINLENKKVLIIGGGKIAFNKLQSLLPFTKNISIYSKDISDEIKLCCEENSLEHRIKDYDKEDLKDFDIVVVAINDISLQEVIYKHSREYNCLFNCVDIPKLCDFTFASYIKEGDLTLAISTSGNSPAISKQLRIYLQGLLPKNIASFLKEMKEYRKSMPKGSERMKFLEQKAKEYFSNLK